MLVLDALDFGLDGKLTRRARELLSYGYSIDRAASVIHREFDLDCSHSTVNRWVTRLAKEIADEAPAPTTIVKERKRNSA